MTLRDTTTRFCAFLTRFLPYERNKLDYRGNSIKTTVKGKNLIKPLREHGAFLLREGRSHSIFQRGHLKTEVPRHNEILDELARKICRDLNVPYTR